jgi:hypothetical protein
MSLERHSCLTDRTQRSANALARPSTASRGDLADTSFEITHSHHPLRGREFKPVPYPTTGGEDRVYFHDSAGKSNSIPTCWTTVVAEDPFRSNGGDAA